MDLFIMRHGEAGRRLGATTRDADRPLTVQGRKEVEEISESLDGLGIKFERIVASPLKRCHDTALIVSEILGSQKKVEDWDELKPESNRTEVYRRVAKLNQNASILVVGHEPNLSTMIGEIVSGNASARIALKKAGFAKVRVSSFDPKPTGELKWLLTPRQLKKMT